MYLVCWPQYSDYFASHSSSNLQLKTLHIACVYLHNFLSRNSAAKQLHSPTGTLDFENTGDGTVTEGEWTRKIQTDRGMAKLAKTPRTHGNDAKKIRDTFFDYFMLNEGRVSWQNKYLVQALTQTFKNLNKYAYLTFLQCYCFSFLCFITLQVKKHMLVRKPA